MSTATPTPHTTPTGVRLPNSGGGTIGHLLDKIPGPYLFGGIALLLLFGAAMEIQHGSAKNWHRAAARKNAKMTSRYLAKSINGKKQDEAAARAFKAVFGLAWRVTTGREVSGTPASNARFLHRGRRPLSELLKRTPAASQLGTVAIPERPLPALPARPSAAVERWRGWQAGHTLPGALDGAVRRGGAALVWVGGAGNASLQGVRAAGGATRRTARAWGTWPYACRMLVRWAVLVAGIGLWLDRGPTVLGLVLLLVLAVVLAASGPAGLGLWHGVRRGDDHHYGPRLWVVLRAHLGKEYEEEEYHDPHLAVPADISAPDAAIMLLLPDHYAATELQQQELTQLVNSRVPGDWVPRFNMRTTPPHAVWTHRPKPKPKPEPPDRVGFFDPDIQAAIARCKKGEFVVGKDEAGRIIIKKLDDETPHWALSVGTGGGKSIFNMMLMAQAVGQGYSVIVPDVKRVSVSAFIGVPGVYIYNDPGSPQDMRAAVEYFTQEIDARGAISEVDPTIDFPGLLMILEEANELADVSKDWWDANRESKDRAADPMWGDVASGARLGRHVHGNIVGVFQDLRDQAMGGKGVRNLFRLKFMGNFNTNTWKNVVGTTPVPESYEKAGRMMIVEGSTQYWVQTPYAEPEHLREWAMQKRREANFDPAAGLYGTPPAPSPKALPTLLKRASRDKLPEATWRALEGNLGDSGAGGAVTSRSHDASRDSLIPGQRDALGEAPSELPEGLSEADRRGLAQVYRGLLERRQLEGGDVADAIPALPAGTGGGILAAIGDPNERLTLAEISRRLERDRRVIIPADRMRQHKKRGGVGGREFPTGVETDGETLYTMREIVTFYQPEILEQWGREAPENGQG